MSHLYHIYDMSSIYCVFHKINGCTCHGIATLVRQGVDGSEEFATFKVLVQVEFCPGITAVLHHAHPSLVFPNLKGSSHGRDEAADVFKVIPSNTP